MVPYFLLLLLVPPTFCQPDKLIESEFKVATSENGVESSGVYIRDTISQQHINFDIESNHSAFYPIRISTFTGKIGFLEIRSTSLLMVSFYKCGLSINLGNIKKGWLGFDTERLLRLDAHFCGVDRKNEYMKVFLRSDHGRAVGKIRLLAGRMENNEWIYILIIVFLAAFIVTTGVLILTCKCRKNKTTVQSLEHRFVDSHSYAYIQNPPSEIQLQEYIRRFNPRGSNETIWEHERDHARDQLTLPMRPSRFI